MPSAITAPIEDGTIVNAKQFLQQCFKGGYRFLWESDVKVGQDWTSIIKNHFMSDINYHKKELNKEKKRLKEFEELTQDEDALYNMYYQQHKGDKEYWEKELENRNSNNSTYQTILAQVKGWNCPKSLTGLKMMAINQINESMNHTDYCEEQIKVNDVQIRDTFNKVKDDFIAKTRKNIQWQIDYHTGEIEETTQDMNKCLENYRTLMEELNKLD